MVGSVIGSATVTVIVDGGAAGAPVDNAPGSGTGSYQGSTNSSNSN